MLRSSGTDFEEKLLKVVLILGCLRATIELIEKNWDIHTLSTVLDLGALIVFIGGLSIVIFKLPLTIRYTFFYVPLILVLCLSLYESGGLSSPSENNIYAVILIIVLTTKGQVTGRLLVFTILCTVVALVAADQLNPNSYATEHYNPGAFNFGFIALATVIAIFYAKKAFLKRSNALADTQLDLIQLNRNIISKREKIEKQNEQLEQLNGELENRIHSQIKLLDGQKEVMNEYLEITYNELLTNYEYLEDVLTQTDLNSDIDEMILASFNNLENEIESLQNRLADE